MRRLSFIDVQLLLCTHTHTLSLFTGDVPLIDECDVNHNGTFASAGKCACVHARASFTWIGNGNINRSDHLPIFCNTNRTERNRKLTQLVGTHTHTLTQTHIQMEYTNFHTCVLSPNTAFICVCLLSS